MGEKSLLKLHLVSIILLAVVTITAALFINSLPMLSAAAPFAFIAFIVTLFLESRERIKSNKVSPVNIKTLAIVMPLSLPVALFVSMMASEYIPFLIYGNYGVPTDVYSAVIVAPIYEEYSKGLIVMIMGYGMVEIHKGTNIYRSRSLIEGGGKEYAIIGLLSGATFEMIEMIGYVGVSSTPFTAAMQALIRSGIPLHAFNTTLFSLGIWYLLTKNKRGILYMSIPVITHASWNYMAVSNITFGELGDIIFLGVMGVILFAGIEIIVRKAPDPLPKCDICGRAHPGTCKKVKIYHMCPYCGGTVENGKCMKCGATRMVCPNCHGVNIIGAFYCIHCGVQLESTMKIYYPAKRTQRLARVLLIPWLVGTGSLMMLFGVAFFIMPMPAIMPLVVFGYAVTISALALANWQKVYSRIIGIAYAHSGIVGIIGMNITMIAASTILAFRGGMFLTVINYIADILWFGALLFLSMLAAVKLTLSGFVLGMREIEGDKFD